MVSTTEASEGVQKKITKDYNNRYDDKSIQFTENGIKFYVHLNGTLDFNTNTRSKVTTQYIYKNGKRFKTYVPYSRTRIFRDAKGRIKRIGNTRISYNRLGKVVKIGSIHVNYNNRRMASIGGLQIKYGRFGKVKYHGIVKPRYKQINNRSRLAIR